MTNYEWLLNMGGEERQAWFDADHVDANDVLTRKGGVRADDVCANDGFMDLDSCTHGVRTFASESDSREKLEADASELTADYAASGDVCDALYGGIVGLLDRQASITRREVLTHPDERDEQIAELAARVDELEAALTIDSRIRSQQSNCIGELAKQRDELTAERNALADDLLTCNKEREQYRELFSKAITQAAEIVNLQP